MNGKGSPHVALMGGTGSGKTRFAINLIEQIRRLSGSPVILFDMQGGSGRQPRLVQSGRVVASPNNPVPLDVLHIPEKNQTEITNAAMRFRESFTRIPRRAGPGRCSRTPCVTPPKRLPESQTAHRHHDHPR